MADYIAFSGGADSTALALLMADAIPVFADTGWEFPELHAHIDKFERVTGREVVRVTSAKYGTLPEYIREIKFLPGFRARYCTRLFKIESYNDWLADKLPAVMCVGLRADEPDRTGNTSKIFGLSERYPLRWWGINRAMVERICTEFGLMPEYPAYMVRGGCMGCFYKRPSEIKAMIQLIPDVVDELQELEESIQDDRKRFAYMFPNCKASIREMRQQGVLFDMAEYYVSNYKPCSLFCNR